ncbi:MAG: hypothetical protein JF615_10900, partial [Asticcacaulis sp.]|nr:hypothetical protein [Asticcacaulis sp.]
MTQDSNAGERDEAPAKADKMETDIPNQPTAQEIAAAREVQDIADGHRYQTQEFRDARDIGIPRSGNGGRRRCPGL